MGDAYPRDEYCGRDTRFQSEVGQSAGDVLSEFVSLYQDVMVLI